MDSVTEYGEAPRSYPTATQGSEDPTNTQTPRLVARCRQLGVAAERARPAAPTPTCKARQKDRRARWDSNPAEERDVRRESGRIDGVELSRRTKSARQIDSHVQARREEPVGGPAGIRNPGAYGLFEQCKAWGNCPLPPGTSRGRM
jgi:hypothetical protein